MHKFYLLIVFFCLASSAIAQDYFLTGHNTNINEKDIYYKHNNTLIKPVFGCENQLFDSLIFTTTKDKSKNWFVRKLFHEHLIDQQNERFKIIVDPFVDFRLNYDSHRKDISYYNKRGFNLYGNLMSKIYINTGFEENQAKFPQHIHDFYNEFGVIPGYGRIKQTSDSVFDFSNSYGSIAFKVNSIFNFTLGYDKLFIGDGYRSMLLSDFSAPYMFFKSTISTKIFEYNNIITKAINPNYNRIMGPHSEFNINSEYPSKIISYNCLTFNIKNNWRFTLFDALVLPGDTKFFPVLAYALTPYIRDFAVGFDSTDPNLLFGINLLYQNKKIGIFYGQFVIDELRFNDFNLTKAIQVGYKNFDLFNIKNLYFQVEYNTADLFMYSNPYTELHYGHQNQTLAHPAGNCFDEILVIGSYSLKNFELLIKANYLKYKKNLSYNLHNIFNSQLIFDNYYLATKPGNQIINLDAQLIYNLNKSNRLQVFGGFSYRKDKFKETDNFFLNFGLRTALRYNYYDF